MTCREHIRAEKEACRLEGKSTGKLFWQRLRAMFDEVNDTEQQAVFKHERGPLTTWCKMQTTCPSQEEGKVVCMALIRLNAKSEPCYHTGRVILEYFQRVGFKTAYPQLFAAIRGRADYWLAEVLGSPEEKDCKSFSL
eukprot:527706-Amphidinium_carterae.2